MRAVLVENLKNEKKTLKSKKTPEMNELERTLKSLQIWVHNFEKQKKL